MMISGGMSRRGQLTQKIFFRCLLGLCLAVAIEAVRVVDQPGFRNAATGRHYAVAIALLLFFGFQFIFIGSQFRRNRKTIVEFACDGISIQFRRFRDTHAETRPLSDIAGVSKWRGLGEPAGFRLCFRDGSKAFVNYSLPNARELEEQLRSDNVAVRRWLNSIQD